MSGFWLFRSEYIRVAVRLDGFLAANFVQSREWSGRGLLHLVSTSPDQPSHQSGRQVRLSFFLRCVWIGYCYFAMFSFPHGCPCLAPGA